MHDKERTRNTVTHADKVESAAVLFRTWFNRADHAAIVNVFKTKTHCDGCTINFISLCTALNMHYCQQNKKHCVAYSMSHTFNINEQIHHLYTKNKVYFDVPKIMCAFDRTPGSLVEKKTPSVFGYVPLWPPILNTTVIIYCLYWLFFFLSFNQCPGRVLNLLVCH